MIITTLAPTNIDRQLKAVNTWHNLGYKVTSVNSTKDIETLDKYFDVEFIETTNLGTEFGKDYVRLNAIMENIKEDSLLINSDIEILDSVEIPNQTNTLTLFTRNDYSDIPQRNTKFVSGFDAFYITKEFAKLVPQSKLVIGQCHWDYYLPIIAVRNKVELFTPYKSNMYHKTHAIQYNTEKWRLTGTYFARELGLSGNVLKDSNDTYRIIKNNLKYY